MTCYNSHNYPVFLVEFLKRPILNTHQFFILLDGGQWCLFLLSNFCCRTLVVAALDVIKWQQCSYFVLSTLAAFSCCDWSVRNYLRRNNNLQVHSLLLETRKSNTFNQLERRNTMGDSAKQILIGQTGRIINWRADSGIWKAFDGNTTVAATK